MDPCCCCSLHLFEVLSTDCFCCWDHVHGSNTRFCLLPLFPDMHSFVRLIRSIDRPTSRVCAAQPVSRRNLWDTLIKTMQSRAVVLTTHSMEEAEALCTRIGIMVKGQLRALGTPQHLKQKYGSGYEIIIKLDPTAGSGDGSTGSEEQHAERVIGFITEVFPSAGVLSDNGGLLTMRVPPDSMNVGSVLVLRDLFICHDDVYD